MQNNARLIEWGGHFRFAAITRSAALLAPQVLLDEIGPEALYAVFDAVEQAFAEVLHPHKVDSPRALAVLDRLLVGDVLQRELRVKGLDRSRTAKRLPIQQILRERLRRERQRERCYRGHSEHLADLLNHLFVLQGMVRLIA